MVEQPLEAPLMLACLLPLADYRPRGPAGGSPWPPAGLLPSPGRGLRYLICRAGGSQRGLLYASTYVVVVFTIGEGVSDPWRPYFRERRVTTGPRVLSSQALTSSKKM